MHLVYLPKHGEREREKEQLPRARGKAALDGHSTMIPYRQPDTTSFVEAAVGQKGTPHRGTRARQRPQDMLHDEVVLARRCLHCLMNLPAVVLRVFYCFVLY